MLFLQKDVLEQLRSHARTDYPEECCGILLGRREGKKRIVCRIIQTGNMVSENRSTTQFLIDPLEIVKTESLAEGEGLEIVGFYHSHPDHEADASNADILHMIEGFSYPIISVKSGTHIKMSSFEKTAQTDIGAKEENIIIEEN